MHGYRSDKILDRVVPFAARLDPVGGTVTPQAPTQQRHLADLDGLFADETARAAGAAADNRLVYRVVAVPIPDERYEVPFSVTTIEPGDVGGELFMTKGHVHDTPEGEIYLGTTGTGLLLLHDGTRTSWVAMAPNVIGYIPPGWAHRSVNVGDEPYGFLAVYPGAAGHDYDTIAQEGIGARVTKSPGGFAVLDAEGHPVPAGDGPRP